MSTPSDTPERDGTADSLDYWVEKKGIALALEQQYPNLVREHGTIRVLLDQYRATEEALHAVAREALEKRE